MQSGPVAEVTRIGYVMELEPSWSKIADELPKLIPYLRDYRATAGPVVVRILQELTGRVSASTPLDSLRSLTGVFRALLATSWLEETIAIEGKPLTSQDIWLIQQGVLIIKSLILDAALRLHKPWIIEIFAYLVRETFRFAYEHRLQDLLHFIELAYKDIQTACDNTPFEDIKRWSGLFSASRHLKLLKQEHIEHACRVARARSMQRNSKNRKSK
jgi:hypothetical protein